MEKAEYYKGKNFRSGLKRAGVKWRWTNAGLRFYLRSGSPQRMRDGSYWNGTEHIGTYKNWETARTCGVLSGAGLATQRKRESEGRR